MLWTWIQGVLYPVRTYRGINLVGIFTQSGSNTNLICIYVEGYWDPPETDKVESIPPVGGTPFHASKFFLIFVTSFWEILMWYLRVR